MGARRPRRGSVKDGLTARKSHASHRCGAAGARAARSAWSSAASKALRSGAWEIAFCVASAPGVDGPFCIQFERSRTKFDSNQPRGQKYRPRTAFFDSFANVTCCLRASSRNVRKAGISEDMRRVPLFRSRKGMRLGPSPAALGAACPREGKCVRRDCGQEGKIVPCQRPMRPSCV